MICQWHLVKNFGCKFSLSMACSHWPTIWLLKGGWGWEVGVGGGGVGMVDLVWVRIFFPTSSDRIFFPDIQQCKILFPTLHAHYIFSVGIFFFARYSLQHFFPSQSVCRIFFLWNHPYPLLKVKWSIPNPNWPHCFQCSMLTCSVLTRPQHCALLHFPRGPKGAKNENKPIVFSHDVTTAILVSQNNETAAMLVSQTNPVGVGLFSYAKTFFCSNKFA